MENKVIKSITILKNCILTLGLSWVFNCSDIDSSVNLGVFQPK